MNIRAAVDGVLVEWGERLFYPRNRTVKSHTPRLRAGPISAAEIRSRIEATVRRAPQVMVKVTGGGRGMAAIAAHFRYISKNGRLDIEDDRGTVERGKDALTEIERQWRVGGSYIGHEGERREAFNVMLSMPRGTDPLTVQRAAREFAKLKFADHRYVMVLHDHQANPHVHLSVKVESKDGKRLNPRKADLHRWRETFAERLREWGVDAEATRQATRGEHRNRDSLWRRQAKEQSRRQVNRPSEKTGPATRKTQDEALAAWKQIAKALAGSEVQADRTLALDIVNFLKETPVVRRRFGPMPDVVQSGATRQRQQAPEPSKNVPPTRDGPTWER